MIEQLSNSLKFVAFFTESKLGKTGLTVTCDIYKNGSSLSTGNACTEIGGGLYSYTLASGSVDAEGDYIAIFKTATTSVDQQHLPSLWVVNKAGVENLDAAITSRNATAPPTAAAIASQVRTELTTELGRIDVSISSRNATTPPTAAAIASQVRTELTTELGRIDAAVSSRAVAGDAMTLTAGTRVKLDVSQPDYAPAKAGDAMAITDPARLLLVSSIEVELTNDATGEAFMQAIADKLQDVFDLDALTITAIATAVRDAVLDRVLAGNHTVDGSAGLLLQSLADIPSADDVALATRAELSPELGRIDVAVSSRNATTPPTAAAVASQVRTELGTELGRIDTAISTRTATEPPSAASIAAAVWAYATRTLSSFGTLIADVWSNNQRTLSAFDFEVATSAPSAAEVAGAVWDEASGDHVTAGSMGAALGAAGNAGDPWAAVIPGDYAEGTAGQLLAKLDVGASEDPVTVVPEAPADQDLCRVYGYFENVGNSPAAGAVFVFTLIAPGLPTSERGIIGRRIEATTNAEGYLQVDLQRNDLLTPTGSKYRVECKALNLSEEVTLADESFDLIALFGA